MSGGRAGTLAESSRAALLDFLERGHERAKAEIPDSAARGAPASARRRLHAAVPFLGVGEAGRLASSTARRGHLRAVA